jgi:TrmH family RNA methyltransferase
VDEPHAPLQRVEPVITSAANPAIKLAKSLQRRRVRQRERAVLVEGTRAISTALEHGAPIRYLFVDATRIDQIEPSTLDRLSGAAGRTLVVANLLFQSIADTEHPQPLIAVCAQPERAGSDQSSLVLALDGVRDPGNLGTLVRSAVAAGVDSLALLPGCVDPFNAKVVRASAGLVFALPIATYGSLQELVESTFQVAPRIVVADADGPTAYDAHDWTVPSVLVLGGEAEGVSRRLRTYADVCVAIPMAAGVESLNVAISGAVILFEAARQRRIAGTKAAYIRGEPL